MAAALLDTSTISRWMKRQLSPAAATRVDAAIDEHGLLIASITFYEIERGIRALERNQAGSHRRAAWQVALAEAQVIKLEEPDLRPLLIAADLHSLGAVQKPALVVSEGDLLIVATAVAHGLTLLTSDQKLVSLCAALGVGEHVEYVA